MIKPLWCVYYEYMQKVDGPTFYDEIHVPAFDIGEALQNGTRAVVGMRWISTTIVRIERTSMHVALEAE
jgi:hypothetical protein